MPLPGSCRQASDRTGQWGPEVPESGRGCTCGLGRASGPSVSRSVSRTGRTCRLVGLEHLGAARASADADEGAELSVIGQHCLLSLVCLITVVFAGLKKESAERPPGTAREPGSCSTRAPCLQPLPAGDQTCVAHSEGRGPEEGRGLQGGPRGPGSRPISSSPSSPRRSGSCPALKSEQATAPAPRVQLPDPQKHSEDGPCGGQGAGKRCARGFEGVTPGGQDAGQDSGLDLLPTQLSGPVSSCGPTGPQQLRRLNLPGPGGGAP